MTVDPATIKEAGVVPYKLPHDQREARLRKLKAERIIRQFPQFSVLLDIDSFLDYPPYQEDLRVADFINSAFESGEGFAKNLYSSLQKG